jgi:hypothetical protein
MGFLGHSGLGLLCLLYFGCAKSWSWFVLWVAVLNLVNYGQSLRRGRRGYRYHWLFLFIYSFFDLIGIIGIVNLLSLIHWVFICLDSGI